ncbi:MAG: endonuclease/exonuclease/phosphatase family protein, partial [Planctomycetota bacterium]|nr:endonuclease/exonuclease/phosphatase family protein [Planctomycetota bacterium]
QGFAYGFGRYVGQYNMAVYSKYPIRTDEVRRFHTFPWEDLPGNIKPKIVSDAQRLFDKDFWDVPIEVGGRVVHLLMCHAVVPVFDETNDERNFDTLRFIKDYVEGNATYATLDGGMKREDLFVVVGDLNADPDDGESRPGAVQQLLDSDRILVNYPEGDGRDTDGTPPDLTSYNTTGRHFLRNTLKNGIGDTSPGGFQLQLDYLLPSKTMRLGRTDDGRPACGVFWSRLGTPEWELQRAASDHHFVWTDVIVPAAATAGEAAQ